MPPLSPNGYNEAVFYGWPTTRDAILDTQITLLIGLDDTDNLDSCGTGFHARAIASGLHAAGLAEKSYVTRHQLLVSPLVT